jgi:hypothetical protein
MRPYYNPEHEVGGGNLLDVGRDGLQDVKMLWVAHGYHALA